MMNLATDWRELLADEFEKDYMLSLQAFLDDANSQQKIIYPQPDDYFTALNSTPFNKVKVVILGQDPYHGEGQAHGLSFSVKPGVKVPPSLVNIYKELEADLGISPVQHGFLKSWAEQGVLLLNSVLTVEAGNAGSHQKKGWELFTDRIIELINQEHDGIVFMLWGAYAQKKGRHIDREKHCVLESVHPSPLSVYRGFFGCRHFSQANSYLESNGKTPINWKLEPLLETNEQIELLL
ncbi:uracil-DNA glycosylase [Marinomonas transparens]|uniref:Uracil-DNA glycosylase n=1 Tax=Marinomonas transparens TaxID=2795388 RepID=A0A934JT73_9GAMM|nr:uracil-DNA glycosylase [Marinomonas transparens]MBJ7536930.1 uracil-DNA glycosylase [Marinomonas transparens]